MPAAMALVGGAALSAGGGIVSGIFANKAAKKQAKAIKYTADVQRQTALEIDAKQRADLAPFRQYGIDAGNTLSGMLMGGKDVSAALQESPLYKFQSEMGTRDINRQLASRGLQSSGAGLETLSKFTNQLVADEGQRFYDRLYNMTALGENAAARMSSNTVATGNQLMQTQGQLGLAYAGAKGAEQMAWGQAAGGTLSAAGNTLAQYPMYSATMNMLNRYNPQQQQQPSMAGMSPYGPYQSGYQYPSSGGGGFGLTGF